jgi:hypothetical protein
LGDAFFDTLATDAEENSRIFSVIDSMQTSFDMMLPQFRQKKRPANIN